MKFNLGNRLWQWMVLLFLAFIWGSSFILMKKGLESYTSFQVASLRMFIAFVVLVPFAIKPLLKLKRHYILPLLAVGLFGNAIPAYLFTKAQTVINSSFAGMLNTMVPLFTLVIGVTIFGMKVKWMSITGVIIGLAGATGLLLIDGLEGLEINLGYGSYVIAATVCYGLTVNVIKKYLQDLNAIIITSVAFVFIGPITGMHLFSTDFLDVLGNGPKAVEDMVYIIILGIFGTALAVVIFNFLIKRTTALFATTVTYLIPIVAIFWGIIDEEPVSLWHFLFMAIILIGVYLVNINPAIDKAK